MGKFLKIAFYGLGTFLLVFSSIIVSANFIKDSGVFEKSAVEVKKQVQEEASNTKNKKIIVNSEPVEKEPAKETAAETTAQDTKKSKLTIEVINRTDISGLAEDVRAMIETLGFTVSAGNDIENKQGTSQIIIRKKGADTSSISSMLRITEIKEELKPDSRFDITVIIGSDFNP